MALRERGRPRPLQGAQAEQRSERVRASRVAPWGASQAKMAGAKTPWQSVGGLFGEE